MFRSYLIENFQIILGNADAQRKIVGHMPQLKAFDGFKDLDGEFLDDENVSTKKYYIAFKHDTDVLNVLFEVNLQALAHPFPPLSRPKENLPKAPTR